MKLLTITLFLQLFLVGFLSAQNKDLTPAELEKLKHPVHSALFKVEGKGLTKPSYLFGTIHLGDPRLTTLHPTAEKAFQSADHFYGEVDPDPAKMLGMAGMMMRTDGTTLSKSIGPDLTKKLNTFLKGVNPAFGSSVFDPMKTWVMIVQLPVLQLQMEGKEPLDMVLYERAKKAGKTLGGLETIESQLMIFNDLDEKDQVMMLDYTLDMLADDEKNGKNATLEMLNTYLSKDLPELGAFVKKSMKLDDDVDKEIKDLNDRFIKKLLDDRNVKMADAIAGLLEKQKGDTHFFAVGAAHYVGPTAIQKFLTKKGYTVTPLFK